MFSIISEINFFNQYLIDMLQSVPTDISIWHLALSIGAYKRLTALFSTISDVFTSIMCDMTLALLLVWCTYKAGDRDNVEECMYVEVFF